MASFFPIGGFVSFGSDPASIKPIKIWRDTGVFQALVLQDVGAIHRCWLLQIFIYIIWSLPSDLTLMAKCSVLFSDVPAHTHVLQLDADVGAAVPVKQHPYSVAPEKR